VSELETEELEDEVLEEEELEEEELEEEELEEENITPEKDDQRKLYIEKVDKSTSDLFRMIKEGELNLQPEYQRRIVWKKKMMSKFIESLLLSIPVPTIFLAENDDDTYEVIDGQQRLTTIFLFMKAGEDFNDINLIPEYLIKEPLLTLSGLETLSQFNTLNYSSMNKIKRKFNNVSLPIVIIQKDSSENIKYDIFSRINSGSIRLNNQELLNVMYRGTLIKALNRVASTETINTLFGNKSVLKKRFGYHEILLRAIALECFIDKENWNIKEVGVKNFSVLKKPTKKYNGRLNSSIIEYLKEYRNDEDEALRLVHFLEDATRKVNLVFGKNSFKRIISSKSTSINRTVAELQLVVLSRFDLDLVNENKELIKSSFFQFIQDKDDNLFTRATNNTKNFVERYEWGRILSNEILGKNL
jgi:hypothetical protein